MSCVVQVRRGDEVIFIYQILIREELLVMSYEWSVP